MTTKGQQMNHRFDHQGFGAASAVAGVTLAGSLVGGYVNAGRHAREMRDQQAWDTMYRLLDGMPHAIAQLRHERDEALDDAAMLRTANAKLRMRNAAVERELTLRRAGM